MTRSHEHEIEIEATPKQVWRALTDADQLTGWYVERAEVELRAGGQYFISWERGWTVGARSTSGSHLTVSAWSISRQVVATRPK